MAEEVKLGLPANADMRWDLYEERRKKYEPWRDGIWLYHDWSFQEGTCLACGQMEAPVLRGREQTICLDCMTTAIPWYPTGHLNPKIEMLTLHMQNCTSH